MKIEKLENRNINGSTRCRVKESGNITEIMAFDKKSKGSVIRKLDKNTYVDIRDGEIKDFKHQESRADDLKTVAKSLAMGRDLINSNVTDVSYCRWLTLTYAENMRDSERLANDFKVFNRACRQKYGHYEYITAAEPQGRGAWHLHVLLIFPAKAPYMANKDVAEIWKNGFVKIKKLDSIDNVGAYLTAYLGDIDLEGALNAKTAENGKISAKNGKSYVKGGRLPLYPAQMHIFRWSKGIKKPEVSYMSYDEAKEKVSAATLTYKKALKLQDDESGFENNLMYEYYNSLRPKSQEWHEGEYIEID